MLYFTIKVNNAESIIEIIILLVKKSWNPQRFISDIFFLPTNDNNDHESYNLLLLDLICSYHCAVNVLSFIQIN